LVIAGAAKLSKVVFELHGEADKLWINAIDCQLAWLLAVT